MGSGGRQLVKFIDIQEASHHITHPILKGIEDILRNVPDGGTRFGDSTLAGRRRFGVGDDWKEITSVISSRYGKPIFHGDETDSLLQTTVWKTGNGREIVYYYSPTDQSEKPIIEVLPTGESTRENWDEFGIREAKYHNQKEMVTCPECRGKGGKKYPHMGEYEWDSCWTCNGRKVVPKKKVLEARYAGQHPFMAKFVDGIWNPHSLASTPIPDDVEIDYVVKTITQMFGKPVLKKYPNIDHVYQWVVRIPEGVAREGEEVCYIEVYKRKRVIRVNYE